MQIDLGDIEASLAPDAAAAGVSTVPFIKPPWPFWIWTRYYNAAITMADFGDPRGFATLVKNKDTSIWALAPDKTNLPGWPLYVDDHPWTTSETTADVNGDGHEELISGGWGLHVLTATGEELPGWPFIDPELVFPFQPIVARFRDYFPPCIVAAASNRKIFVFDRYARPLPGWPVTFPADYPKATVQSLGVGDVTGDGTLEVVAYSFYIASLLVYDLEGRLLPPYPLKMSVYSNSIDRDFVLGDLDGDGTDEIIYMGYSSPSNLERDPGLHVLRGDGTPLPGWPQPVRRPRDGGISLGDVDGDGELEVFALTPFLSWSDSTDDCGAYLWDSDGTPLPGWPQCLYRFSFDGPGVIGDVNGDGRPDLIAAGTRLGYGGSGDGKIYAWSVEGEILPGFPIILRNRPFVSPGLALADLDRDGIVDLGAIQRSQISSSAVFYWFDLGTPYYPGTMEWPASAHDMARTRRYQHPVERIRCDARLSPPVMHTDGPAPSLTVSFRVPSGMAPPDTLLLGAIDGSPTGWLEGHRLGNRPEGHDEDLALNFRFDGEAIRSRLANPRTYRLTFVSEFMQANEGFRYEGTASLVLHEPGSGPVCNIHSPRDSADDQDEDGVCGDADNCPGLFNPDQVDTDEDGIGALCDNCPVEHNPDQADDDGDLVGDVCDACPGLPDADQADEDADGVGDLCDNCVSGPNPDQEDGDRDGSGDVCDNCPVESNELQEDADRDGVGDTCDNCPQDRNPDQADADGNGVGDACTFLSFVYVATNDLPNSVAAFRATHDGTLSRVPGSPFQTGGYGGTRLPQRAARRLAWDTRFKRLYAINSQSASVSSMSILASGAPRSVRTYSVGGSNPQGLAIDSANQVLYVGDVGEMAIRGFYYDENGILTPMDGLPLSLSGTPVDMVVAGGGSYLYVSLGAYQKIAAIERRDDGTLAPLPGSPFVTASCPANGLALAQEERRLFVACGWTPVEVLGLAVADDGTLSLPAGTRVVVGGGEGQSAVWLADHTMVMVNNYMSTSVGAAALGENGELAAVSGTPFMGSLSVSRSVGLAAVVDESLLFASHPAELRLSAMRVLADGSVMPTDQGSLPTGQVRGKPFGGIVALDSRDEERDGVPNFLDNCPQMVNPLQEDADGDGAGDLCDIEPDGSTP